MLDTPGAWQCIKLEVPCILNDSYMLDTPGAWEYGGTFSIITTRSR